MTKATGIVAIEPNRVELQELTVGDPNEGQVVMLNHFSAVSPGTELRVLSGAEGGGYPYVGGYSSSGVVIKAGANSGCQEGDRACCAGSTVVKEMLSQWGGHASCLLVGADRLVPLPEKVDMKAASLAKIAAISYHGFRLAQAKPTDHVIVLGLGLIGQLSARLFASRGSVTACDLDAQRVAAADQTGVEAVQIDRDLEPIITNKANAADVLVDATGVAAVLRSALKLLAQRPWGDVSQTPPKYIVQGSYAGEMTFPYQAAYCKETQFMFPRDMAFEDIADVLTVMAEGKLMVDDLVDQTTKPADAQQAFDALSRREGLTAVFDWQGV